MSESETSADGQWRREVASRVHQHRARRGRDSDAEQAMAFDFSAEEALIVTDGPVVRERVRRRFESDTLMAANGAPEQGFTSPEPPKIIRFPRSVRMLPDVPVTTPPLASEVTLTNMESSPRIVDVEEEQVPTNGQDIGMVQPERLVEPVRPAEQMELLPSFADITLESAHHRESTESEVIPRPAALSQRVIAGAIDVATVVMAAILFNFSFVRMAEDGPHSRLALLFGLCVAGTLWTLFQYLFLVHGRGTPGMRFAQLELATFDGKPLTVMTRRCRAAASALSAASIGLGYAWAFVDEDRLGWHDRITRTLLRSSTEPIPGHRQWWDQAHP